MIGIVGCGKMGMAIVEGLLKKEIYSKDQILLCARSNKEVLEKEGFQVLDLQEVFLKSDILLCAIKPQNFEAVFSSLKGQKGPKVVISIAAGVKISQLERYFGSIGYARVMPNTPALLGCAASAICFKNVSDKDAIMNIFNSIGMTKEILEEQMDDIIPANGSLPAYVYYFIKAFVDSSVKRGISEEVAKDLVCQSLIGSSKMVLASSKTIDELISDVCSKGGTTIEGLKVLQEENLDKIIDEACIACRNRSVELGKTK